ncbi:globin-like protein [Dunaliella salina]|uniref:Globin-like protein n=1 Tax=Dunaliella salina TaxID=3046 RepID=A0ABQ7GBN8_DUNSA|nr:globin-like protein [Dunaliella salina]|eukprot:KAF5832004.1 globin-like protein [Dunaliella salina]
MGPSLYERLGGHAAVEAAVDVFYNNKVLKDETLAPYFTSIPMDRQIKKQVAFLTAVFGGSTKYSDDPHLMFRVHAKLIMERGMNLYHFHKVCTHLLDALLELKVPEPLVEEVGTLALSMEPIFDPANYDQNAKAAGIVQDGPAQDGVAQDGPAPYKPATLYERIGGAAAVKATVDVFYDKIMRDSLLVPYFEVSTCARLHACATAMEGPGHLQYDGKGVWSLLLF